MLIKLQSHIRPLLLIYLLNIKSLAQFGFKINLKGIESNSNTKPSRFHIYNLQRLNIPPLIVCSSSVNLRQIIVYKLAVIYNSVGGVAYLLYFQWIQVIEGCE